MPSKALAKLRLGFTSLLLTDRYDVQTSYLSLPPGFIPVSRHFSIYTAAASPQCRFSVLSTFVLNLIYSQVGCSLPPHIANRPFIYSLSLQSAPASIQLFLLMLLQQLQCGLWALISLSQYRGACLLNDLPTG